MSRRVVVMALALGCTPELEPIRWQPIDIDALREAIANPTGTVDEAGADQVAAAIVQRHEPYRVLANYLHEVFIDDEAGTADPVRVLPQALEGTSVYVLVACPGPVGSTRSPFSHGSMRIDSPTLDAEMISSLDFGGQLRLSFTACEIEDLVFAGVARAYHGSDPAELGVVPQLTVARRDQADAVYRLLEPVLWDAPDRFSALFELSSGETLALDWYATHPELRLRGNNGALVCEIVGAELECVPP